MATLLDLSALISNLLSALKVKLSVDNTPPAPPQISSLDSNNINGALSADNIVSVKGTAEANSTVKLYDGGQPIGSVKANDKGEWNFTSNALSDGRHDFTAIAVDAAGNASKQSAAIAITVDTSAPANPTLALTSKDTGVVGDHITSVNKLSFAGSAEAGSTVKILDGNIVLGSAIADAKGNWTFTSNTLQDGAHNFSAIATDAAGHTSKQSAAIAITVDTSAPTNPTLALTSKDTGVVGDHITSVDKLSFGGSAEAGSTVKILDGNIVLGSAIADAKGNWTFTSNTLQDGAHNFSAIATDAAGNNSKQSAAIAITVDTSAPTNPTLALTSKDTGVVGDHITSVDKLSFAGSAEAGSTVKILDGNIVLGSAIADAKGNWTFTSNTLQDGAHNFSAIATDAAGNNSGASSTLGLVIDSTAPSQPSIASMSPDTAAAGDHLTAANKITFAGSAEANSTVNLFEANVLVGTSVADAQGHWTFTSGTLADGNHHFTAVAVDAAGNVSNASSSFDFAVDTTAPQAPDIHMVASDEGSGSQITTADSLVFSGSAEAYSTVQLFDGQTLLGSVTANSVGKWSYESSALAQGDHSITAFSVDQAGNTSLDSTPLHFTVDPANAAGVAPGEIGINLSGAEASVYLGNTYAYGETYTYPTTGDLDYFQSKGIELVRLPISWEAMEPTLNGQLDPAELSRLTDFLKDAEAHGMKVIVDLHNFGRYYGETIGSKDVPVAAFQDFWTKLAGVLKDNPAVVGYDIMNEPHDMGGSDVWPNAAQAAVNGIRSVDQNTTIYVEGDGWSTASTWLQYNANLHINDPANNLVYEAHQYFGLNADGSFQDYDASGAYPTMGVDLIQPFVQWLEQNDARGYMGEFAVRDDDPRWVPVLDNFVKALQSYGIPGTYWSAGSGTEYLNFSVQPLNGQDRPQLSLLSQYAGGTDSKADPSVAPELHTFNGTSGDDYLSGYSASDTLFGGGGHDVFVVYDSGVKIVQTSGADNSGVVQAYADYILPSESNVNTLLLYGTADHATANNTGSTLVANDTLGSILTGGLGNDVLVSGQHTGQGHDVLIGGGGSDVFVIYNSSVEASQAAGGNNCGTIVAYADYTLGQNSNIQTLTLNGSATHATANDQGATLVGNDTLASILTGGNGNDTLVGGQHVASGHNTMTGGGGNDTFIIYNSADTVSQLGGAGNSGTVVAYADYALPQHGNVDTLILKGTASHATASDDGSTLIANSSVASTLTGGHGNDVLVAGASNDTFVFGTNFGKDVITGFTSSGTTADKIVFDTASFANWDALQKSITESAHGDAIITAANGDTVTLMGVHAADLHQQHFQFTDGLLLA